MMVAQSYNVFNRYGKDSNALADITRAFIEDLQEYHVDDIRTAFTAWRKGNDGMPAPANIIKIIKSERSSRGPVYKDLSDFDGDWPAYKRYLDSLGLLNPKLKA